jgi:hypothetical protein
MNIRKMSINYLALRKIHTMPSREKALPFLYETARILQAGQGGF